MEGCGSRRLRSAPGVTSCLVWHQSTTASCGRGAFQGVLHGGLVAHGHVVLELLELLGLLELLRLLRLLKCCCGSA